MHILCTDWILWAGEKEVFHGVGGYSCDNGREIAYRDGRQAIQYNPKKERLTIWGANLAGPASLGSQPVMLRETTKTGRYRADLTVASFRMILRELQESEARHRESQIERLNRFGERHPQDGETRDAMLDPTAEWTPVSDDNQ